MFLIFGSHFAAVTSALSWQRRPLPRPIGPVMGLRPPRHLRGFGGRRGCTGSDCRLGEGDPQVIGVAQLVVVHFNEGCDGFFNGAHLDECHFSVLRKELERHHGATRLCECLSNLFFGHGRPARDRKKKKQKGMNHTPNARWTIS
uniref:Putative secreted protein n=1 Tax=Amblyomma cajennense TaxID=34607 RepID=A0A023FC01_AMBCJ